ncbi:MAG TPA: sigma-70 family RNA polymerase sigma factor [Candidatus Sulfotelmatobacter sp.]|nr:sigma-70 family RNA polymerase sigma factor [Candidatus Sulfotelmatobacter sp.]
MERVAEGDAVAFEHLMRRNMRRALSIAQGVLGNAGDADEIAQEAFMRVWLHAQRWNPEQAGFATWFYRIVLNLCLDRRRKPLWLPIDEVAEMPDANAELAPEIIAREENRRAVTRALENLSERHRAAIALFYFEGLSGKQAAEVMNLKAGAFGQLLLRARMAIKAELQRQGLIEERTAS